MMFFSFKLHSVWSFYYKFTVLLQLKGHKSFIHGETERNHTAGRGPLGAAIIGQSIRRSAADGDTSVDSCRPWCAPVAVGYLPYNNSTEWDVSPFLDFISDWRLEARQKEWEFSIKKGTSSVELMAHAHLISCWVCSGRDFRTSH